MKSFATEKSIREFAIVTPSFRAGNWLSLCIAPAADQDGMGRLLRTDAKLLITTPRAFAIKRFIALSLWKYQHVHSGHTACFSLSTLSQILSRYRLEIESVNTFQWREPKLPIRFVNALLMLAIWFTGGRLCYEMALIVKAC